jgi:capsular exopolysaccharide synthesis family protein
MTTRPSISSAAPSLSQSRHFSDYLRVLSKRRWMAGLAFLAVFAYGAVSTLKKTPIYEATAQVLIEKEVRRATSLNTVLDDQQSYYDDDFYPTQFKILQSRRLAWRAIEALGMNRSADAGEARPATSRSDSGVVSRALTSVAQAVGAPKRIEPPPADETSTQSEEIGAFLSGLTVAPVRNTRLVDVTYMSPDPVIAERAANAVVDQYIKQSLDFRLAASKEANDYLSEQLEEQRKKVEESETALQQYKETHDAVALDDKENTVVTKLADLSARVTRATSDRMEKEGIYKSLLAVKDDRDKLEGTTAIVSNRTIQDLKAQLRDLRKNRADQAQKVGPMMLQGIDTQIKTIEATLYAEEDKVVEAIKNDYLTAKATEESLASALAEQNRQTLSLNRKGIEYAALQREAASNRTLYDNLLQRAKETGVSSEFKGSNIQVVDRAEIPREPVLPRRSRDLFIAFLQGVVLALVLAFGFEYLDSRIKTPDELKTYLGLPFLGLVPSVAAKELQAETPLINNGDVPPSFSEAIRAIRTSVIFSSADEGARTVVITSTAPSEGKTLISSNLAVGLAQAGQRTLIIDGDMRRPRLHEVFGKQQEPGLSNVLVGTSPLHDALAMTSIPNLYVLPAGHLPPNPAELLGSTRYLELIEELRQVFDWILIDAPPVMAVTDAAIISHTATGVVFVVGAEMTSRRNAVAAVEQLQQARAKFIGAVLNRVNLERHSYYYSPYYRKDYSKVYERSSAT